MICSISCWHLSAESRRIFAKKTILILLLLLVTSFFVSPDSVEAGKERWKAIAGKNGKDRILYDPDSVISLRPGVFRVWIMGFDMDHSPRKSQEEIDCSNKIIRDVEVITENLNKPKHHTITPSDWTGIVRDSPRGELFKVLCR